MKYLLDVSIVVAHGDTMTKKTETVVSLSDLRISQSSFMSWDQKGRSGLWLGRTKVAIKTGHGKGRGYGAHRGRGGTGACGSRANLLPGRGFREKSRRPKEGWAQKTAPLQGWGRKRHTKKVVGEPHSGWCGIQQQTTKITSTPRESTLTRLCKIQTRHKQWKVLANSRHSSRFTSFTHSSLPSPPRASQH